MENRATGHHLSMPLVTPAQTIRLFIHNGRVRHLRPYYSDTPRLRIDVRFNPRDFLVCLLGSVGYSAACIADQTSLSVGQVRARLKAGNVHIKDYRNGQSKIAKLVLDRTAGAVRPLLEKQLTLRRLPRANAA